MAFWPMQRMNISKQKHWQHSTEHMQPKWKILHIIVYKLRDEQVSNNDDDDDDGSHSNRRMVI